jgi:DNA-binding transcriptional MocR family regulator
VTHKLARCARAVRSGAIEDMFTAFPGQPDAISLAVGGPATALLPAELFPQLVDAALARYGLVALQGAMTRGLDCLSGCCRCGAGMG